MTTALDGAEEVERVIGICANVLQELGYSRELQTRLNDFVRDFASTWQAAGREQVIRKAFLEKLRDLEAEMDVGCMSATEIGS